MTIKEWLTEKSNINHDLHLDAELILLDLLGFDDKSALILHENDAISDEIIRRADEKFSRRLQGEPLAYILQKKEFYGRDFYVDKNVLIPRPETEIIIDLAKEIVGRDTWWIYDIGAGSGCIAVTLALELSAQVSVTALDVSAEALKVARKNAENHGILPENSAKNDEISTKSPRHQKAKNKFNCVQSNLLTGVDFENSRNNLIIANLPYVDKDWNWLNLRTLGYEPEIALFAEDGGLSKIFTLLEQVEQRCCKFYNTYVIIECDPSQQERLGAFAKNLGFSLVKTQGFATVLKLN